GRARSRRAAGRGREAQSRAIDRRVPTPDGRAAATAWTGARARPSHGSCREDGRAPRRLRRDRPAAARPRRASREWRARHRASTSRSGVPARGSVRPLLHVRARAPILPVREVPGRKTLARREYNVANYGLMPLATRAADATAEDAENRGG